MDRLRKIMTESQRWQQGEMLLIELIRNKESNMSVEPWTLTKLDEACDDDEYNRFYVFTLIQKRLSHIVKIQTTHQELYEVCSIWRQILHLKLLCAPQT